MRYLGSECLQMGTFQLCGESQGTLRYFQVADGSISTKFYLFTLWIIMDYEKGERCCELRSLLVVPKFMVAMNYKGFVGYNPCKTQIEAKG
uniref:Uncharacterized protein n=1 Tax=Lactuca sativa TaxID=4236 RepID=A0A9R1XCA8_LACSA|nr:hypothetical protein LSAT_V11C500243110 [Lactuca sativa]